MSSIIIKYMFINTCVLFLYHKITNPKTFLNFSVVIDIISLNLFAVISYLIAEHSVSRILIMLILSTLYISIIKKIHIYATVKIMTLCYGLSFIAYTLSGILIGLSFFICFKEYSSVPFIFTDAPTGILELVILYLLFRSKRLRNGISFILYKHNITFALFISICLIICIAHLSTSKYVEVHTQFYVIVLFLIISLSLLFYWRHRITQTYREKLRQANEKSMLDEIAEHKATIEKLKADNKRLASIVHADNKLVPAMLTAVTSHLENSDHLSMEELTTRGREISEQLHSMAKDRQGILDSQHNETAALPKSGLHTVDGMLSFMKARAEENHIVYKVTFADTIKDTALNALSEEDLLRLLGDLIDNAIIAVNHSEKEKAILIHLGILQDKFLVEISDSGIPFSIETYQRFGNEQYTTHKDSGGSGIGLMDIWKIKKKYKASLHIYEFPEDHGNYTKKISFVFDRKNHFLLQTNRYKEITRELTRGDLYIFPYQSE